MKPEAEEPEPLPSWELAERKAGILDEIIELELLKNNTVVLHGELNEEMCNKACKRLLYLYFKSKKSKKPIKVIINSVGGEVYHGLLVFNTLEDLKKRGFQVIVEARGLCASMGLWILMGGTIRVASKYTRFLLHETSSFSYGKVTELKEGVEELEKLNLMLDEIVVSRTKLDLKTLQQNTKKREWWLSSEEALKYGIIEAIV